MITAEQNLPVITVVHHFDRAQVTVVDDLELLDGVLEKFMKGKSHFAIVRSVDMRVEDRDPTYRVVGVITLEDVLEVIMGQKITDEFDHERGEGPGGLRRAAFRGFSTVAGLSEGPNGMRTQEARAMAAFLLANVKPFKGRFGFAAVEELVQTSPVVEFFHHGGAPSSLRPDERRATAVIAARDEHMDKCYVVLKGTVRITSGKDAVESTVGPWDVIGSNALVEPPGTYKADFSATALSPSVLLLAIGRSKYDALVRSSAGGAGTLLRRLSGTSSAGGGGGDGAIFHAPAAAPISTPVPGAEDGSASPRSGGARLPELLPSRGTSQRMATSPALAAARAPVNSLRAARNGSADQVGEFFVAVGDSASSAGGTVVGVPGAVRKERRLDAALSSPSGGASNEWNS
jgi:hypothetical protein